MNFFGSLLQQQEPTVDSSPQSQEKALVMQNNLAQDSKAKFNDLLAFLDQTTALQSIEVISHHSNKGNGEQLQALGHQNAIQFKQLLVDTGISEQSIKLLEQGSRDLIASEESVTGQQLNNRIEVVVHLKKPVETALAK